MSVSVKKILEFSEKHKLTLTVTKKSPDYIKHIFITNLYSVSNVKFNYHCKDEDGITLLSEDSRNVYKIVLNVELPELPKLPESWYSHVTDF